MKIIIISAKRGEGKTTFLKKLAERISNENRTICGFYAKHLIDNQNREGYTLTNVSGSNSILLCKRNAPEVGNLNLRGFWFDKTAIKKGEEWLKKGLKINNVIYFIDEIGLFETEGFIWNNILKEILQNNKGLLIITVRDNFVNKVIENYELHQHNLFIHKKLLFTVELMDKIERGQNG